MGTTDFISSLSNHARCPMIAWNTSGWEAKALNPPCQWPAYNHQWPVLREKNKGLSFLLNSMWSLWRTVTNTSQVCPSLANFLSSLELFPWEWSQTIFCQQWFTSKLFPGNSTSTTLETSCSLPRIVLLLFHFVLHDFLKASYFQLLLCHFMAFCTFCLCGIFFVLTFVFFGSSTNFYDISFCHFPPLNHLFPSEFFSRKITLCVVSVGIWKTVQIEPSKTVSLWSNF